VILIIGATGLVGSAALRQLTARGVPVRALVRSAEKAATLVGPGVETVIGDLEQPASLQAALDRVTRALLISPLHPRQSDSSPDSRLTLSGTDFALRHCRRHCG